MRLAILIICWAMLAFGVLAFIGILVQMDNGTQGDVPGLLVAIVWIVQNILVLSYIHGLPKEEEI